MFVKIVERTGNDGIDWKVSFIECVEAHYIPASHFFKEKERIPEEENIQGYLYLEPNNRRITMWKPKVQDNVTHIYLLNEKGKTIDTLTV